MSDEQKTRSALHAQLLDIERQHRASIETEKRILESAEDRLTHVQKQLESLRPQVLLDDAAADRYQELILERGQLHQTIAMAKHALRAG